MKVPRLLSVLAGALVVWPGISPVFGQKWPAQPPRVTRSPYLQIGTPSTLIIRWRTPWPTESVVRYGLEPGRLEAVAICPGRSREHVVRLSGLSPDTKYFYSVGTFKRAWQEGPGNYFITAPAPDSTRPIRAWVIGDSGTDWPCQKAVREAYDRFEPDRPTDLVLALGDNAYRSGTDAQYQKAFFDVYRQLLKRAVLWPTLGNHDARSADSATQSGVYYGIFTLPTLGQAGGRPSGTEAYYSFDYGQAHFVCLDSQGSDLSNQGPMLAWLEADLAANRKNWTIAFWHHCPYSKGSHDSDDPKDSENRMALMRENVLPIMEAAGVDLVLCGHSHLYERSFLLHGCYGKSDTLQPGMILDRGNGRADGDGAYRKSAGRAPHGCGTVYVNAGSAGHATKEKALHGLNHSAMCVSLNIVGSFVLDLAGPRLDGTFLDDQGRVRDAFTIMKSTSHSVRRP